MRILARVRGHVRTLASQDVVRGTAWLYVGRIVGVGAAALFFLAIVRSLSAGDFGRYGLAMATVALVFEFIDLRTWEAAIALLSGREDDRDSLISRMYTLDMFLGVVAAVASLVVLLALREVVNSFAEIPLWLVLGATLSFFIVTLNSTSEAMLRLADDFRSIALIQVRAAFPRLLFALVLLIWDSDLRHVLAAELACQTCLSLMLVRRGRQAARVRFGTELKVRLDPRPALADPSLRRMLWMTNANGFVRSAVKHGDTVLVGLFTSAVGVGQYRLARGIVQRASAFVDPLYEALYPQVARHASRSDISEVRRTIRQLRAPRVAAALAVVAACVFLAVVARLVAADPALVRPVFGLVGTMAIGMVVWALASWIPSVLLSSGGANELVKSNLAGAVAMGLTLVLLVPMIGPMGAAVGFLVNFAVWYLVARRWARMRLDNM